MIDGPIIEGVTKAAEELQLQLGGSRMCMDSYSALGKLVAACAWTTCADTDISTELEEDSETEEGKNECLSFCSNYK